MAISLVSAPNTWARVWDTNRMTYTFSSNNTAQPNFQFQFVLIAWNWNGSQIQLGTYNLYPLSGGTVEFNPSVIYRNYLSYDYVAADTALKENLNSARKFSLSVYEYYGTPPVRSSVSGEYWTGEVGSGTPFIAYNGCQQNIPYDYTTLNILGNYKWVMSNSGTGQFLTDATEYRLDNRELAFLYFNAQNPQRPTRIRYTIYYKCYDDGQAIEDKVMDYFGLQKTWNTQTYEQGLPVNTPYYDINPNVTGVTHIGPWTGICSATHYDTSVSYTTFNSLQYRFPMGPYQLLNSGILTGYTDTWLYYNIDLLCGSTVMNNTPFQVYRSCKSDKYGRWQLTWLNKHGGFDTFTFDRKTDIDYKISRSTYKQKLIPNPYYSTYDAGERVYMVESTQEITLRSNLLTQKEAQILTGLFESPVCYVNTIYNYNTKTYLYGVPYIVMTTETQYKQKVNEKEVYIEIKIRPANQNILQND